jgi:hypothetical protein
MCNEVSSGGSLVLRSEIVIVCQSLFVFKNFISYFVLGIRAVCSDQVSHHALVKSLYLQSKIGNKNNVNKSGVGFPIRA